MRQFDYLPRRLGVTAGGDLFGARTVRVQPVSTLRQRLRMRPDLGQLRQVAGLAQQLVVDFQ